MAGSVGSVVVVYTSWISSPQWLTEEDSAAITPPNPSLVERMKHIQGPAIITPKGVVAPSKLLNVISEVEGREKAQKSSLSYHPIKRSCCKSMKLSNLY